MHSIAGFCAHNISKSFPGIITRPPQREGATRSHTHLQQRVPGAWTQTPISAWLASVSLFPFYEQTTGPYSCCNFLRRRFTNSVSTNAFSVRSEFAQIPLGSSRLDTFRSASEMTYIVSSGALNSTHSLDTFDDRARRAVLVPTWRTPV